MAWDYYREGALVGPYRIIEAIKRTQLQGTTIYTVAWRCCGTHVNVSHREIAKRVCNGVEMCKKCTRKQGFLTAETPAPVAVEHQDDNVLIVGGHRWPSLSRMGPRWAPKEDQPRRNPQQRPRAQA